MQDLELEIILRSMAQGDAFIYEASQRALLTGTADLAVIRHRQSILQDCLRHPDVVRQIYQIPIEALINKRKGWMGIFSSYPSSILASAVEMVQMFLPLLRQLREIADAQAAQFASPGFARLFAMLQAELDDAYFAVVQNHLKALRFGDGVLLSAVLGKGNEGAQYVLRKPNASDLNWLERVFSPKAPVYSFRLHPRDDSGARALSEIQDRGLNAVANALAQAADHIDGFFNMLRAELAFYIGCLNLAERLGQIGAPIAFPEPAPHTERRCTYRGLYDVSLALTLGQAIVGNDGSADGKELVVITGANQGGKSTFLRSIGQAQLMLQCGLFVAATQLCANVCTAVFTHFRREEDASMTGGKLDEELGRMSAIVDAITPHALLLFNESFAATNEREGSEIGRQIVAALLERRIKIFFVTHLFELAHSLYRRNLDNALFLRAERQEGGARTFKVSAGAPLQTSFGVDLYEAIFGDASPAAAAGDSGDSRCAAQPQPGDR